MKVASEIVTAAVWDCAICSRPIAGVYGWSWIGTDLFEMWGGHSFGKNEKRYCLE